MIRDVFPRNGVFTILVAFVWFNVDLTRALIGHDPAPIEPVWNDGTD